jgi:hypothetical protein
MIPWAVFSLSGGNFNKQQWMVAFCGLDSKLFIGDPDISADNSSGSDHGLAAENRGIGIKDNIVFDGGMPFLNRYSSILSPGIDKAPSVTPW